MRERLLRLRPRQFLNTQRDRLKQNREYFAALSSRQLKTKRNQLASLETRLRLLGPEQVLSRGYSITMADDTGKIIRSAGEIKAGQTLRTRLKSGEVTSIANKAT